MPFITDQESGQRDYAIPLAAQRRAQVRLDGELVQIIEREGVPVALVGGIERKVPSGRMTSSGELVVKLDAAAARAATAQPVTDEDVANAALVAAIAGHPVTAAPATFVFSHHLAHALGEDPDVFSNAYDTLIGPTSVGFRASLGRIDASNGLSKATRAVAVAASRSRADAWLRDERILALDLYFAEGPNPRRASVVALSELLRDVPIEPELAHDPDLTIRTLKRRSRVLS